MRVLTTKSSNNYMNNSPSTENPDSQALLNQIVIEFMKEQKRKRRWRWVKRVIFLLLLALVIYLIATYKDEDKALRAKPHVGLIDISGTISDTDSGSAENFAKGLDDAYKNAGLKAVIIRINSPGGSAVQADYMYNTLQYYRQKYPDIKTYAVCVDMCASAAYYVAAGTEEIYANPSSMVGSIGVLYNGFGFTDVMQKIGVSRRLQTAGVYKGFLDPFSPIAPGDKQLLQTMLDNVHQQFIAKVKEGRGNRLKIDDTTFSGLFWTGQEAKDRGLIDGFGSSGQVARNVIKLEQIIDYTNKQSVFERMAKNIGTAIANQLPIAMGMQQGIRA